MKNKTVGATEFKAKCLAYLDEIERHGEPITITRRGRPVAVLGRAKPAPWKSPANNWAGNVEIVGDIVSDMSELWNVANKDRE
ncbi:MAG TPA: type II toxin-antitoxin system Phd/YefM family antitoxin [Bryobacteraceae bacterium]|nr:type II toxin-antitoxin system Phd/YefM family antitoxin [Bryobacteraceae bacterium]